MLIKKPSDIKPSEITPESVYRNRRQFMKEAGSLALGVTVCRWIACYGTGAGWRCLKSPRADESNAISTGSLVGR